MYDTIVKLGPDSAGISDDQINDPGLKIPLPSGVGLKFPDLNLKAQTSTSHPKHPCRVLLKYVADRVATTYLTLLQPCLPLPRLSNMFGTIDR